MKYRVRRSFGSSGSACWWLEGLIQGIQATLFAQQMAAQQQLANMEQVVSLLPRLPETSSSQEQQDSQDRPGLISNHWRIR
ncbi:MAG: hypothetical protein CM15mP49_01560 [Actinomycetota bacterium]|nr:MAG: hypothetical protein CM15mP49_01560 [Actinomycetota bacterium]